jgi:ribonuclease HI
MNTVPNADEQNVPEQYRTGIVIFADGACSRNGTPDAVMSGSFMLFNNGRQTPVMHNGKQVRHVQLPASHYKDAEVQTSPVAECMTLIAVLNYVQGLIERSKRAERSLPTVTIVMDNEMAVNFANQAWKAKQENMKKLRSQIVDHPAHSHVSVQWMSGDRMKKILGH